MLFRSTANTPGRAEGVASARDAISQAAMSHGLMPDPLPPEPPERALQRLGPLELPGAPEDLETRLAALYQQLVGAAAVEDEIALAETETETESETEPEPGNWSASDAMEPRSRGRRGGQGA